MTLAFVPLLLSLMASNPNVPRGVAFPGQRTANDAILAALVETGRKFWRDRGTNVPDNVALDVADDLSGVHVAARGLDPKEYGEARIVLDGRNTGIELRRARSKRRSVRNRRAAIERLGATIAHELGHVAGTREHTEDGLMSPQIALRRDVPWDVILKARELVPQQPKSKAKPKARPRKRYASGGSEVG